MQKKKPFYEVFDLKVSPADDEKAYLANVVYGDTFQSEGDILRDEFKREPSSSRAKNRRRNFRCLIIDEVDSMCIASTKLSAPFPSYDFLKILYPYIYNTLNIIDNAYNRGYCGTFIDEKTKEEFIVSELEKIIKEIININKKNSDGKFIIPKNLEKFVNVQLREWS